MSDTDSQKRHEEEGTEQVDIETSPEGAAVKEDSEFASDTLSDTAAAAPAQQPEAPAKSGGSGAGVLALLLALAALGLSGWQYYQGMLAGAAEQPDPASIVKSELAGVEAQLMQNQQAALQELGSAQDALRAQLAQQEAANEAQLNQLESMLQNQRQRLLELGNADRDDWVLAETEYLLRLANQRLLVAADLRSALALLASADDILLELDDPALNGVRLALASDLAALRAVPALDIDGTWMRIQALIGQVDALMLFELPVIETEVEAVDAELGWEERLSTGIDAALDKFSSYLVYRRRDSDYQALIDPQRKQLVRQNLRMLLEQSRSALLSRNQVLYQESLADTRRWLAEFFSSDETSTRAIDEELASLQTLDVSVNYPDLTTSIAAVRTAIGERHRVAGQ